MFVCQGVGGDGTLQEAAHLAAEVEVEDGVGIHEHPCHGVW
jgi:hypothetical protein